VRVCDLCVCVCVWLESVMHVACCVDGFGMTYVSAWHSCRSMTLLLRVCHMTQWCLRHDACMCVTWLIVNLVTRHWYVTRRIVVRYDLDEMTCWITTWHIDMSRHTLTCHDRHWHVTTHCYVVADIDRSRHIWSIRMGRDSCDQRVICDMTLRYVVYDTRHIDKMTRKACVMWYGYVAYDTQDVYVWHDSCDKRVICDVTQG